MENRNFSKLSDNRIYSNEAKGFEVFGKLKPMFFNIKVMQSIIITPTNSLTNSLDFYHKLNFTTIEHGSMKLVTDGKVIIEINENSFTRTGAKLFRESWKEVVKSLQDSMKVIIIENGYLINDGNGVFIYLMEGNSGVEIDSESLEKSTLGNSMGLSIEAFDIEKTIDIWSRIGFSKVMGSIEQGWLVYSNKDGLSVSFMQPNSCPHLFFNPSLTYFNGKNNLQIIEKIRQSGVAIIEEVTVFNQEGVVDNVILRDNGGLGFFVFSD